MKDRTAKVLAKRLVVVILNNNIPDLVDEGMSEDDSSIVMAEYNKIIQRLTLNTTKQGGEFNRLMLFEPHTESF